MLQCPVKRDVEKKTKQKEENMFVSRFFFKEFLKLVGILQIDNAKIFTTQSVLIIISDIEFVGVIVKSWNSYSYVYITSVFTQKFLVNARFIFWILPKALHAVQLSGLNKMEEGSNFFFLGSTAQGQLKKKSCSANSEPWNFIVFFLEKFSFWLFWILITHDLLSYVSQI